jgi:hypothetical protein
MSAEFVRELAANVAALEFVALYCQRSVETRVRFGTRLSRRYAQSVGEVLKSIDFASHRLAGIREDLAGLAGNEPRDNVRERFYGGLARAELLAGSEFEVRDGRSRASIAKAVRTKRLFFIEFDGVRAYPAFFADTRYRRRDLESVTRALGDVSPGGKYLFFVLPKGSLYKDAERDAPSAERRGSDSSTAGLFASLRASSGRTPLQALEEGDIEAVLRAAAGYAQL